MTVILLYFLFIRLLSGFVTKKELLRRGALLIILNDLAYLELIGS